MNLDFRSGRTAVAARLHALERIWDERGVQGLWVRNHAVRRRSLFTPYGTRKSPTKDVSLKRKREATGELRPGRKFRIDDDWTEEVRAH